MLNDAFLFFLYGVSILFLLLIPVMMMTHDEVSKWRFLLTLVFGYTYFGVVAHVICKASDGKGKLRQTLACYFYLGGIVVPLA